MQQIDFYCRKCKKSMKMAYVLTGNASAPVMPGMIIRCHTHKCTRVASLRNYTEGKVITQIDAFGKFYI